jgi:hypothetical protein
MKEESDELQKMPDSFICPLTLQVMTDPVICADGHNYEREAIESWLERSNSSPLTGEELVHKSLMPNCTLRALIENYTSDAR